MYVITLTNLNKVNLNAINTNDSTVVRGSHG